MTGTGGRFKSFNNPEGIIQNQEYEICLRQEIGNLHVQVQVKISVTPDTSFIFRNVFVRIV
jgi:hypothetical protein